MRSVGVGVGGVGGVASGRHERQVSVDSGSAELDWSSEDGGGGGGSPTRPSFVTVVAVGSEPAVAASASQGNDADAARGESFVTVLAIGAGGGDDACKEETTAAPVDKQETIPTNEQAIEDDATEASNKHLVQDVVQSVENVPIDSEIIPSDVHTKSVPTVQQQSVQSKQTVTVDSVEQVTLPTDQHDVSSPSEHARALPEPNDDAPSRKASSGDAPSRKASSGDASNDDDNDEDGDDERDASEDATDVEDVVVYRLPGERLGFGLRFEGGAAAHEPVRRLLVQSLAVDSPAGRATCAWGRLAPGDQLLRVDGVRVRTLTRLDCVRRLKEARVVVTLRVRRGARCVEPPQVIGLELKPPVAPPAGAQAPPVPPRKLRAHHQPPPLPAECYLDVVGLEERAGAQESESDDTGSSLSTALERRSTANSSFSDALPPDPGRALERLEREIAASLDALLPPAEFKDTTPPDLPPRASPPPPARERFRSGKRRAPPPPPPAPLVEVDLCREADVEGVDVATAVTQVVERFPSAVLPTATRRQSVPEARSGDVATAVASEASVASVATACGEDAAATDSEDDEPISLDYSVLEELSVPASGGGGSGGTHVDDAPCWPEDAEFRVTAVSTPGDVLFPSGWGAALPTILEEDAVVGVARPESKPRLVVEPAEDVPVVDQVAADTLPVEGLADVKRAPEDGDARLAKEAAMEPPPPPFSRLPPDGHEFPARYEEDGFRFKPEPKPRRGQAEGTKSAPEVPARPSLDEPATFRCKAEVALQVEAFHTVPSKAEEFKPVPSREEEFLATKGEERKTVSSQAADIGALPVKAEILTTMPSKVEEFEPVPNKEETFRQNKAEEFVQVPMKAQDCRPVTSKAVCYRKMSSKAENFITLTNNSEELRSKKTEDIFKPVPSKAEEYLPGKAEELRTLPNKPENFSLPSSKAPDDHRSSSTEDFRSLPRKSAVDLRPSPPTSKPRAASWRSDERSDQSVRDKIAMFGRPSDVVESATLPRRPAAQRAEAQPERAAGTSTLPRKPPPARHGLDDAVIMRRELQDEPRLHTRSHSLLDLSQRPLDELRRTSLAALVEQRRRGMSKLRGLVIPERSEPAPPAPGALDLPEIHSREEATLLQPWPRGRSASLVTPAISRPASYATLPTPPKTTPPLPRTLPPLPSSQPPPFTRSKEAFAFALKQDTPPVPKSHAPAVKAYEPWATAGKSGAPPAVAPKTNGHHASANGVTTVKTKSNGLASVATRSGGLAPLVANHKGHSPVTMKTNGGPATETSTPAAAAPATYVSYLRPQTSFVSTLRPTDAVETGDMSDTPPPLPPNLPPSRDDFDGLPRDSGHHSASRTSSVDSSGGRVLAPRSLEAMNRKSVLSSARHSSGRDLKIGSPQIQRKFSDSEDSDNNDADEDSDSDEDDEDEGDFCDEGAVESDDLVFFSGREKPELPAKVKPVAEERAARQPAVRVAYVTQVMDAPTEMLHVSDGRRRRLLVSGQPRAEPLPPTKVRPPKVSLNEALKELIAPREAASKPLTEPASTVRSGKVSSEAVPKDASRDMAVDHTPKKQATNTATIHTPKDQALKASVDSAVTELPPKVSTDENLNEHTLKALKHKATKPPVDKIPNGHTQNSPKEHANNGSKIHTSKDRIPNKPTSKEPPATAQRDRRCVSVSEIHVAFQKAERMAHARSASLDAAATPASATLEVVLRRASPGAGLGLALAGGADLEAKRVTVHKVLQGGAAARDGRLRRGDHVVRINGAATRGLTHAQSVAALKEPRMEVTLTVSRADLSDSEPCGTEPSIAEVAGTEAAAADVDEVTVTLVKESVGLGFSLDGGRDSPHGDVPLTVKKLFLGGVAERSGLVCEGDRVLRIGAWDTALMSRLEAWAAMKRLPEGPVVLTLGPPRP